ncbi:hypothetical protein [Novosphingobium barchaimii]|uniref:hypothetical protein n=1 Tax=Novosphingobium barchaimii TaxID=1420591 RepID=UPI0011E06558|nr:hypothetical protein [Novosphingobium barchaimii]
MTISASLPAYLNRDAIGSITERDIDVLVLEGLLRSSDLSSRLATMIGLAPCSILKTGWRSATDNGTETDIFLLYADDTDRRCAVLIENKVNASFQPNQAGRARLRGQQGRNDNHWDAFRTVLFAPRAYLADVADWDAVVTHEAFAEVAKTIACTDFSLMIEALAASSNKHANGSMVADERATVFWKQYRDYLTALMPGIMLTGLGSASSTNAPWPRFAKGTLPPDLKLEHKPRAGAVDLTLSNASESE